MDFGEILDQWEKLTPGNMVDKKDGGFERETTGRRNLAAERRGRLLRKKPDAVIDLHGLNSDEAWIALQAFFEKSRSDGLEKLRIIHGKGGHAAFVPGAVHESVLKDLSRRFIETCSYAGESGQCHAREGGAGATWVILR